MSTTYSDATGVLLFDGPARITPVLEMLFKPFNLNVQPADDETRRYVNVLSEDSDPSWNSYVDHLIASQPDSLRKALLFLEEPPSVLREIGLHLDVDLDDFIAAIDFENRVDIVDIVRLAQCLQDGHNLIGLSMEGGWHGNRALLWAFGGWAVHTTPRCSISLSTPDVLQFAESLDDAIATSADSTADVLSRWLNRFIDGITDSTLQRILRDRYGLPDPHDRTTTTTDDAWSRSVYVGALATDEGGGPEWARIEVTPEFIRKLQALRTACRQCGLSEASVVDAPAFWGPGVPWNHMLLFNPRLVVTPDSFWFTVNPSRRVCAFETLPLSLNWLFGSVTESGEPLYRRIDAAQIKF